MSTDTKYTAKQITEELLGGVIVGSVQTPESDDPFSEFAGINLAMPDGTTRYLWIQRDAEGNGAGWLDIETPKEASE
jgi:hypothetical protein